MKYVIIGGSAAGIAAAETLRRNDKASSITLVSDEELPLYSRCLLTYLIAGSIDESKLIFKNEGFYKDNDIKTYLGKKAVSIDAKKKNVSLEDGTKISYDKLLIATGAAPKLVDIPGVDKKGVFTLRKIEDARAIIESLDKAKNIAILGGGLIGLRDAYAFRKRGMEVAVIVKSPHILSQMLDEDAARIISSVLEENGIKIMTGIAAKEIKGKESVEKILLDNGKEYACGLVIIGKGVTPNAELASLAGLKVNLGISVDEFLRTSDRDIFAAGDVAETFDVARGEKRINGLWPAAVEQGEIAALNMPGKKTPYDGALSMNSVDFFGLASISMGVTKPKGEGYEIISKAGKNTYKKFVLKEKRIVGMVLAGEVKIAGVVSALIRNKIDVSSIKYALADENFDYAKIIPLVKKFEDKFKQDEYTDTTLTFKE